MSRDKTYRLRGGKVKRNGVLIAGPGIDSENVNPKSSVEQISKMSSVSGKETTVSSTIASATFRENDSKQDVTDFESRLQKDKAQRKQKPQSAMSLHSVENGPFASLGQSAEADA